MSLIFIIKIEKEIFYMGKLNIDINIYDIWNLVNQLIEEHFNKKLNDEEMKAVLKHIHKKLDELEEKLNG
jgi:hypothetical protein|tara:strand:- start:1761 stop:1970 length:210 start_codon:yes stop_codon:yes gene_type:complete